MVDRYLTAEEFIDAIGEVSGVLIGQIDGSELGTPQARITRIELSLSDGRTLEITCDTNIDHEPELLISEITHDD